MGSMAEANVNSVYANRDGMGRFIQHCSEAAERTAQQTAEYGANLARSFAPVRSGELKGSIESHSQGKTGTWTCGTDHWRFMEFGTNAHVIYGKMYFPWKGGFFVWNDPKFPHNQDGGGAWVYHPGNKPQPFMRPSYEIAKREMMAFARANY